MGAVGDHQMGHPVPLQQDRDEIRARFNGVHRDQQGFTDAFPLCDPHKTSCGMKVIVFLVIYHGYPAVCLRLDSDEYGRCLLVVTGDHPHEKGDKCLGEGRFCGESLHIGQV